METKIPPKSQKEITLKHKSLYYKVNHSRNYIISNV